MKMNMKKKEHENHWQNHTKIIVIHCVVDVVFHVLFLGHVLLLAIQMVLTLILARF